MHQQIAFAEIERWRKQLDRLALDIWENPEGPYREYHACEWTAQLLRDAGFDVEVGVGGIKTAIRATCGSGKPVFGLLGEYDALPGMSQKVCTHKESVVDGGWGQACGHNLLGVAHAGAAIGLKKAMEEGKLPGTVIYFGCPAEEVLTGKALIHADTNRNHNHDRSRPDYNAKHRQRRPQPSLPEVAQCHINHVSSVHKDIPSLSSSWITSVTSSTKSSSSKSSSKSSALLTLSAVLFGGSF